MATKVLELRAWAEDEAGGAGSGERDNAPRHTDREWRQVSVNHRECLGAAKCPFGQECFAELAREKAQRSHLIVTNHSLLAIDAIEGVPMIPDYDVVVVDEAHELVSRITQAATDELFAADVDRAAKRSQRHMEGSEADDLADAGDALRAAINDLHPGRIDVMPEALADALATVRTSARACLSAYPKGDQGSQGDGDAGLSQAKGAVQELFATAERMAAHAESDVLWVTEASEHRPPHLCVAPLQVWGPMRDKLLTDKLAVFTSATLRLGGDFTAVASSFGLKPAENVEIAPELAGERAGEERPEGVLPWRGLDVGSPFDYAQQAILYVARHLPPPGRDGLGQAQLDEIVELVDACEGRALGLFSSRRAAETAAEAVRERLPHLTTLAQGDAQLPELAKQFVDDPHTALFGTLSLWQGLDVPGDTCQLVLIDRIPFPRPDDPLMSARQRAADKAGGNGFMQVAATHAALLLAQGSGRLIRTTYRPRRGRRARPAAGHRPLRRLPQGQPRAHVDHHRPDGRPQGAGPARSRSRLRRPVAARASPADETLGDMRTRLGTSVLVALVLVVSTACASSGVEEPEAGGSTWRRDVGGHGDRHRTRHRARDRHPRRDLGEDEDVAAATPRAAYEVCFSSPATHGGSDPFVVRHFIDIFKSAGPGDSLRIAMFRWDIPATTKAIVGAQQRGAHVEIVADADMTTKPAGRAVISQIENGDPMPGNVVVCKGACLPWSGSGPAPPSQNVNHLKYPPRRDRRAEVA